MSDGSQMSVKELRSKLDSMVNSPQSGGALRDRVINQMADEVMNKRVTLLVSAVKRLEALDSDLTGCNKPDIVHYQQATNGEFQPLYLFSKGLYEKITKLRDQIKQLTGALEPAFGENATDQQFAVLGAAMKEVA